MRGNVTRHLVSLGICRKCAVMIENEMIIAIKKQIPAEVRCCSVACHEVLHDFLTDCAEEMHREKLAH